MQVLTRLRAVGLLLLLAGFSLRVFALQPGDLAPTLVLPSLEDGQQVSLSGLEGKIIYVDFWASWCQPCRRSLPLYEALQKRLGTDDFLVLAVNLDEDRKDAEKFLGRHPVSYPVLMDPTGDSARDWAVLAMPSSYLVDANGRLAQVYLGFEPSHIGKIEHDIKTLLAHLPVNDTD